MTGIYVRVSTLQQKDNYSVETQRERGTAFASRRGDDYVLYDEALSGKNLERPEFLRLLHDVETKKLSTVWVIEASRLTRDVEDAQAIKRIFKKNKVELYVNDHHVDLSSSESILTYNITSAVSELETVEEYVDWVDEYEAGGGVIEALFLPLPAMINFIDPVVVVFKDDKVISVGYTQSDIRVFVNGRIGFVEADFM